MSTNKQKYYVVWKGFATGVFDNWEACKRETEGYPGAEFKSFKTRLLAEQAFSNEAADYIGKDLIETDLSEEELKLIGSPILQSICVDAAWNTSTKVVEYQGVDTNTGKQLFAQGPFEDGTINVVEFLAIVHALAYCKQKSLELPIYSDSRNAIKWVKTKEVKTNLKKNERNKKLFELIDRAINWLNENNYVNPILKWETRAWGENPADFDRK